MNDYIWLITTGLSFAFAMQWSHFKRHTNPDSPAANLFNLIFIVSSLVLLVFSFIYSEHWWYGLIVFFGAEILASILKSMHGLKYSKEYEWISFILIIGLIITSYVLMP